MEDAQAQLSAPPASAPPGPAAASHVVAPQRASLRHICAVVLASALVPGSGHVWTGHRRSGWTIVGVFALLVLGAAGVGVYALTSPATAASWSVRPAVLDAVRWGAPVLAVLWAAVIVRAAVLAHPGARGWAGRSVAGVLALVLGAAVALPAVAATYYAGAQRDLLTRVFPTQQASGAASRPAADVPIKNGRLDVLLVGSDAGPDRTGTRTDSVILASLDTRTGRTVLFTLPRNLERVPFAPGSVMARQFPKGFNCGDECLLNAIYAWAVEHPALFPGDPDPGMTALVSAVTETLGLPVDYHALVDLAGFSNLVDALGGVTIRVERRLPIGGLDAHSNHVPPSGYIQAGLQHMDGETALQYARSRSDSTDYERIQRQRCLIGAIQRQADPKTLLTHFQQVANASADALQTDIPQSLLPDLVKLAFKVKQHPVEGLAFTPPLIEPGRPDFAAIRADVQAALVAPAAPASPAPTSPASASAAPVPVTVPTAPAAPVSVAQVCAYS